MLNINSLSEIKNYQDLVEFYNADIILNNNIINHFVFEIEQGDLYDEETDEYTEIYQYYIISPEFAETLEYVCPDEIVLYNEELDMYLWGITHFGTSWDYVPINTIFNS